MRKIPTLFMRDPVEPKWVTDRVNPGCEWVLDGEGQATRKFDGTCTMLDDDGRWWARREVKPGKQAPSGFVLVDLDPATDKRQGWEPIGQSSFGKMFASIDPSEIPGTSGTFELCGPKVNSNPEGLMRHALVRHGAYELYLDDDGVELTFDGLAAWLRSHPYEGIVWHHRDGRMAKLKRRDLPRVDR